MKLIVSSLITCFIVFFATNILKLDVQTSAILIAVFLLGQILYQETSIMIDKIKLQRKTDNSHRNDIFARTLITLLLSFALSSLWMFLELCYFNEIKPNPIDDIIFIFIMISFWFNSNIILKKLKIYIQNKKNLE